MLSLRFAECEGGNPADWFESVRRTPRFPGARKAPCPWQRRADPSRQTWSVPGENENLYIVRSADQRPCEEPLDPRAAFELVKAWAASGARREALVELYYSLRAPRLRDSSDATIRQIVLPRLREAFEHGELLLAEAPTLSGIGAGVIQSLLQDRPPPAGPPPAKEEDVRTWIEIELVDQDGKPVVGEKYRIDLPDGTMRRGSLDSNGRARVDQIDPGFCEVSFPGLDASEWRPA